MDFYGYRYCICWVIWIGYSYDFGLIFRVCCCIRLCCLFVFCICWQFIFLNICFCIRCFFIIYFLNLRISNCCIFLCLRLNMESNIFSCSIFFFINCFNSYLNIWFIKLEIIWNNVINFNFWFFCIVR